MARIIVAPTQTLLNKINESFKTRIEWPNGWFKEDENGNVDMSELNVVDIAEIDGNGDIVYTQSNDVQHTYLGQDCYDVGGQPIYEKNLIPNVASGGSQVKILNFDRLKKEYLDATELIPHNIVQHIETGIWVGLITDTNNHNRVVKSYRIIRD